MAEHLLLSDISPIKLWLDVTTGYAFSKVHFENLQILRRREHVKAVLVLPNPDPMYGVLSEKEHDAEDK